MGSVNVENTFRVITYSMTGILTWQVVKQAIILIPAMLVGLWCGMKCASGLKEATVKKVVIIVLMIAGVSLVVTNLL